MNARRRFSLSLVRKSESPKSPISDCVQISTGEHNISTNSGCSTPLNAKKYKNSIKHDSPSMLECDHSPIPMSQDTSNLVSGVSWAWNSPKRIISSDRSHLKPLRSNNRLPYKETDSYSSYRKQTSDRITGFYKFQSELKLLQEHDEPIYNLIEKEKVKGCFTMPVDTSPRQSSDEDSEFPIKTANKKTSMKKQKSESIIFKLNAHLEGSDSFNNSGFDNILLKASQAAERDEWISDKLDVKDSLSCSSVQVINTMSSLSSSDEDKFLHKSNNYKSSITTQYLVSNTNKPHVRSDVADSFDNSDLDNLLLQASQAVEKQIDTTDKLQQELNLASFQQLEKRKSFLKSKTTENFDLDSDDSFAESDFELLMQNVALPDTTKSNEHRITNKISQTPCGGFSRKSSILTRHKSMPESPSHKRIYSEGSTSKSNQSSSSYSSSSTTVSDKSRRCTKEEIEQKRQEALKRHASRLKRLMQGNHSRTKTTILS